MPGPVEIFRLNYTKADLAHVQEDDVVFFFMMCQLHNDIAALLRIVFANWPDPDSAEPIAANRATTCFLAIRTLAGRLEEGWKSIKDLFGLSFRNYPLSQKSQASYQTLRTYFGTSNFIRLLRDNAANHHQREPMREAWRLIPNDHEFTDFTARGLGNTVYWAAENVMTANAILLAQKFQPDLDGRDALEWMIKEVSRMSDHFMSVTTGYCLGFFQTHLPEQLKKMNDQRETVEAQPAQGEMQGVEFLYGPADIRPELANRHARRAAAKREG